MAGPQTHREALIAELLGDVGELLDRAEALKTSLPSLAEQVAGKVRGAGETVAGSVNAAGDRLLLAFDQKAGAALQGVQKAGKEAQAAARVVDRAAWRFALLTAAVGLVAGILGGVLAALAIGHRLFG